MNGIRAAISIMEGMGVLEKSGEVMIWLKSG